MKKCILVAEDNRALRKLAVSSLKHQGYCLLEAADGFEALDLSRKHPGRLDLLITDVCMPQMTGYDLARSIKQVRPDIRVLIVSSVPEVDFPSEAIYHSAALLKPVSPNSLIRKVKELLGD